MVGAALVRLSLRQIRAHRERERRAKNKSRRRRRRCRREWFMRSKLFVVLSFKTRLYSYSFDHLKSHATKSCSFCVGRETVSDTILKNKGNKKDPPQKNSSLFAFEFTYSLSQQKELCVAFECVGRRRRRGERGGGGRRAGSGRLFFGSHLEGCTLCVASPEAARCKREKRSTREKELVVFSRGPERDRAQVHNNNNNNNNST